MTTEEYEGWLSEVASLTVAKHYRWTQPTLNAPFPATDFYGAPIARSPLLQRDTFLVRLIDDRREHPAPMDRAPSGPSTQDVVV